MALSSYALIFVLNVAYCLKLVKLNWHPLKQGVIFMILKPKIQFFAEFFKSMIHIFRQQGAWLFMANGDSGIVTFLPNGKIRI